MPEWAPAARLLVLLALALLVSGGAVAGCGGDSTTATPDASSSTPQPPEGAEESIEGFGEEAEGEERAEVLAAFREYLSALGEHDFDTACRGLASAPRASLIRLFGGAGKGVGCVEAMEGYVPPAVTISAAEQATGRIATVRAMGGRAFVVFEAPGATSWQMALVEEDGEWKVATATPGVLVP